MAERLILLPEAVGDIADAQDWYEERGAGLGREFVREVESCLESIQRHPEMFAMVHESYRRALVRRFPYVIFYEHLDDVITVYAVFHASRNPKAWQVRLP